MAGLQRGAKPPWERKPASVVTNADVAAAATDAVDTRFPTGVDGRPNYLTPTGSVVPVTVGDDGTSTALHSNADFETVSGGNPTIWNFGWNTGGSTATETTDILFGANALTVSTSAGGGNNQRVQSDAFTVAGGDTVVIGCWAHSVTGSPLMAIGLHTAASGTPDFFDGVSFYQESEQFALAGTYTRYTKTFLIPAAHTKARFNFRFTPTAAEATSSRIDFTTSSRVGASVQVLPGNSWAKEACKVANFTFAGSVAGSAPSAVDGAALAVGDRVLHAPIGILTTGIYSVTVVGTGANGTWVRASDASTSTQLAGAEVAVTSGTVYGGSRWGTSFKATDTLGTTAMYWDPLGEPPGMVQLFAGATAPTGWLLCDGTSLPRSSYAPLFAAIGTTYGSINGASFTLPDLRDRVPIGVSGTKALASTGGAATHTLTAGEIPGHVHVMSGAGLNQLHFVGGTAGTTNITVVAGNVAGTGGVGNTGSTGGGGAHNNLQPYTALNYIIKT